MSGLWAAAKGQHKTTTPLTKFIYGKCYSIQVQALGQRPGGGVYESLNNVNN